MNIPRGWVVLSGIMLLIARSSVAEEAKLAAEALKKGNHLFEKGDFDSAISAYTEAIRLDPKNAMAFISRGRAYVKKVDIKELAESSDDTKKKALGECLAKGGSDFDEGIRLIRLTHQDVEAYLAGAAPRKPGEVASDKNFDIMALSIAIQKAHIRDIEAELKKPKVYEPVAETLILYCQSDQKLFQPDPKSSEYLGYAWFPVELRKFGSGWGSVTDSSAFIELGGGFHHFGYRLDRDQVASTPQANVWKLSMCSEDSEDTLLCTKKIPKTRSLSAAELLKRVLQAYDETLAQNPLNDSAHREKIQLLLRFGKVSEARQACKDMLRKMPEDWWANLVCALVMAEEQSNDKAEQFLAAWVKRNPNFFSYLDLAYYHQLRGQPKKAAEAIVNATNYDANTNWGHGGNSEYRGYTAAMYAFRMGEYQATIRLCDKLLAVRVNGDYAKQGLRDLRAAAQGMSQGKHVNVKWAEGILAFDPFEQVNINKLLQHAVERPKPRAHGLAENPLLRLLPEQRERVETPSEARKQKEQDDRHWRIERGMLLDEKESAVRNQRER